MTSADDISWVIIWHQPKFSWFYIENGHNSVDDIINNITDGFYVTDLIGQGVNLITGDYSRGATGFWIEKGQKTYPVSEVTIAGNIIDMYSMLTPASDLKLITGIDAPTILIEKMMVAGL